MIPDAALGISANFDEGKFRNAIKFAMQMGAPNEADRKVHFVKKGTTQRYYLGNTEVFPPALKLDRDGKPLNPEVRIVAAAEELVEIDCAIETFPVTNLDELPVGKFKPTRAEVTVLDVDYPDIQDCKEMIYNGDRYAYSHEPDDFGLFAVDIHSMVFYALDDS